MQAHDDLDGLKRPGELPGIAHVYVDTPGWIDLQGGDDTSDAERPWWENDPRFTERFKNA